MEILPLIATKNELQIVFGNIEKDLLSIRRINKKLGVEYNSSGLGLKQHSIMKFVQLILNPDRMGFDIRALTY